ncbi:hypothetical protein GCM10010216_07860 [Streptomyces flaveolus]|nr:hypothetical protein GCM10010216_07860 [Streptomyces flaveolus]
MTTTHATHRRPTGQPRRTPAAEHPRRVPSVGQPLAVPAPRRPAPRVGAARRTAVRDRVAEARDE